MTNPLPAILIGGPPHAGKSVLSYYLSQRLRMLGLPHYLLRTAPDGEGDWFQEGDPETMQALRRKGSWSSSWVSIQCSHVQERQMPLLVDVGGLPTEEQKHIFAACTHAILLTKTPADHAAWLQDTRHFQLALLADLSSQKNGVTRLALADGVLTGEMCRLERGVLLNSWHGSASFELLVGQVADVFLAGKDPTYQLLTTSLPSDAQLFDFDVLARNLYPADPQHKFAEENQAEILARVPAQIPLASYGRIPAWLVAPLGVARDVRWQFNTRVGWVRAPSLSIAAPDVDVNIANTQIHCQMEPAGSHAIKLRITRLPGVDTFTPGSVTGDLLPFVSPASEVILDGPSPFWLTLAIARAYRAHPRVSSPQVQSHHHLR